MLLKPIVFLPNAVPVSWGSEARPRLQRANSVNKQTRRTGRGGTRLIAGLRRALESGSEPTVWQVGRCRSAAAVLSLRRGIVTSGRQGHADRAPLRAQVWTTA